MKTILIISFLQLFALAGFSCSCEGNSTVQNSVEGSNIVVSAVVLSQTLTTDLNSLITIHGDTVNAFYKMTKFPSRVVKLKIITLFKGKTSSDTITIITPANSAGCGFHFETGKRYIIYGSFEDQVLSSSKFKRISRNENVYWTNECTRTMMWNKDEEKEITKFIKK